MLPVKIIIGEVEPPKDSFCLSDTSGGLDRVMNRLLWLLGHAHQWMPYSAINTTNESYIEIDLRDKGK